MFSRYLPPEEDFHPLPPEEEQPAQGRDQPGANQSPSPGPAPPPGPPASGQPSSRPAQGRASPAPGGPVGELLGGVTREINKLLGGAFRFSLEDLDTGDILLILIVLFLFLEGDDLDLAIALGLTLLLSLGEKQESNPPADAAPSRPEA